MASADNSKLESQVKGAVTEIYAKTVEAQKAIAVQLFQLVSANSLEVSMTHGSPVLTGRYYNSHVFGLNSINHETAAPNPEGADNPYRGLPMSNASLATQGVKLGDILYITNSLDYAKKLEDGFSKKAPAGIYKVAVELVKVMFAKSENFIWGNTP